MRITLLITSVFLFSILSITYFSSCNPGDVYEPPLQGKGDLQSYLALYADHLYVINQSDLLIYQVTSNGAVTFKNTFDTGFVNEGIFIREQKMFVYTDNGLYIYDITQPDKPNLVSRYSNLRLCDPIDFINKYLFTASSTNNSCHYSDQDVLEVMDINSASPSVLLKSFPTETPYDVAIDGNTLFLSRGDFGLQVFDITDAPNFTLLKTYDDIKGVKAIAQENILILTNSLGIDQYNYADLNDIKLLSHIPIQ